MKKENKILNSIKDKGTGFTLPENYLENFEFHPKKTIIDSKTGFSIPKEYFENLETAVVSKVLKINSSGFKTPNNYFKTIDNKILKKLDINNQSKVFSILKKPLFRVVSYAMAASFVLFLGLKIFYSTELNSDFDSVTVAQIDTWIDEDLISFSNYDIADNFADADFSFETNISDEELLDYLEQTDIENLILKE